jgi:hypothetical protein
MRTVIVSSLAFVFLSFLLLEVAPASDGASVTAQSTPIGEPQQEQVCPPAEYICDVYTGGACPVGAYYIGREALGKNYLAEADVKPKDGNELFPTKWEIKHRGEILPFGVIQCGLSLKNAHKTLLEIPVERHCAAQLVTSEHHYIWFFASNPASGCVGYGECVCY